MRPFALFCLMLSISWTATNSHASPLFDGDTVIDVTLTGPLSSLLKNKKAAEKKNQPEQRFTLRVNGVDHAVKVRLRGKSRLRVCKFAPLRLNFNRRDTKDTVFAGQNKIKLVTQCRDSEKSKVDLLEEYAAYRMFNILSDNSYRVRLLRLSYVDADGKLDSGLSPQYGFLLESAKEFKKRLRAKRERRKALTLSSLDHGQAALVFVFQYLIANTDWSLVKADLDKECCHNGDLYRIDGKIHYVPYDFDLAGLVNARYAEPDASVGISRVTTRRYRGYCIPSEPLEAALALVSRKQDDLLKVFEDMPGLSDKQVQQEKKFLLPFFEQAKDRDKLLRRFERRCL